MYREDKVRILKRGIKIFSNFYDSTFTPFLIYIGLILSYVDSW